MTFRSGDIVLVPFPFTDLSASKRRPALLLSSLGEHGDWLCLPVTSQGAHPASLALQADDFVEGVLPHASWVRTNRPMILSESIMLGCVATLKHEALVRFHLAMCRSIDCGAYSMMESEPAVYRP